MNAQEFINGYIEAFYFADTGEDGQPPSHAQLSTEARERIEIECKAFLYRVEVYLDLCPADSGQAGQDFYFTRQRHGVGFWDDYKGEKYLNYSDLLDKAAGSFPEIDFYLSDDDQIEIQ